MESASSFGHPPDGLRHMQSGYVRTYAAWILVGGVLVIAWFLR